MSKIKNNLKKFMIFFKKNGRARLEKSEDIDVHDKILRSRSMNAKIVSYIDRWYGNTFAIGTKVNAFNT